MNTSRIFGILVFLVILIILLITPACKEQTIWTENYGERQIVCVKIPNANESPVKFEFNDGKNLSAVYWQHDSRFGYLYDFRADKIFIDAPSGYFMKTPNDFLESLERNIDCEKIKQSLTPEIIAEFSNIIQKTGAKLIKTNILPVSFKTILDFLKNRLDKINLPNWYRTVEKEQDKIHALELEHCVPEKQAEEMFASVNFNLTYEEIIKNRLIKQKRIVVCVGETHEEDAGRKETIKVLEDLEPLGFKYLLLECVLTADQKILNDYDPKDPAKKTALLNYLSREWARQSIRAGGKGAESYIEVIDAAKKLGYKILGIAPYQRDDIEFLRSHYWMTLNVTDVLKNDLDAKIICLTGATHAFQNYLPESDVVFEGYLMRQDIPDIVSKTSGVETITFECIGGLKDTKLKPYLNPKKVLEKHIENKGWADKRFFIPIPSKISTLPPESENRYYYIHLPQY